MRMRRFVFVFGVLGPIFGSFAFWSVSFFSMPPNGNMSHSDSIAVQLAATLFFGLWGLLLAYPLGLIPAISSGVTYWALARKFDLKASGTLAQAFSGAAVGIFISSTFGVIWLWGHKDLSLDSIWTWCSFPGAVSSALCALISHASWRKQ